MFKKQGYYQESEVFTLSVDNDQHNEIYPNPYYNYRPIHLDKQKPSIKEIFQIGKINSTPENTLQRSQAYSPLEEYTKVWDLSDDSVFVRLVKMEKRPAIRAYEEIKLCYGEHSNGYLLQEYGFTTKDNPFDFVRKVGVTIETVLGDEEELSTTEKSAYE